MANDKVKINRKKDKDSNLFFYIGIGVHIVLIFVSIFISTKCNDGFSFTGALTAFCCPEFYLIYSLINWSVCFGSGSSSSSSFDSGSLDFNSF